MDEVLVKLRGEPDIEVVRRGPFQCQPTDVIMAFQEQRSKKVRYPVQFAGHLHSRGRPPCLPEVLGIIPAIRWQPQRGA
jgi:hypothetical protein